MLRGVKMTRYGYGFLTGLITLLFAFLPMPAEASCTAPASAMLWPSNLLRLFFLGGAVLCAVNFLWCLLKKKAFSSALIWMLAYIFIFITHMFVPPFGVTNFKGYNYFSGTFANLQDYRAYMLWVEKDLDGFIIQSFFYFILTVMVAWQTKRRKAVLIAGVFFGVICAAFYAHTLYKVEWNPKGCSIAHARDLEKKSKRGNADLAVTELVEVLGCDVVLCIADDKPNEKISR